MPKAMSKWVLLGAAAAFSSALTVGPAAASAQTAAERAGARAAAEAGADAFDAGKWQNAITFFEKAEALFHAPPHLLYIARAQAKLGKLVESRETYLKLKRERLPAKAPAAFREAQDAASRELAALEPRIPYLTVSVDHPEGATVAVTMSGAPMPTALVGVPHPVNPGTYEIVASMPGAQSAPSKIVLAEGAKDSVLLTLTPASDTVLPADAAAHAAGAGFVQVGTPNPAAEESSGVNGYVVGEIAGATVGVAGIGLGIFFALDAQSKRNDANDLCSLGPSGTDCPAGSEAQVKQFDDDANSSQTKAIISFAVGTAGLATAAVLFFMDSGDEGDAGEALVEAQVGDVRIVPWLGYGSAGVVGSF